MIPEAPEGQFAIAWVDSGEEPWHPPNPAYPQGIDVEASGTSWDRTGYPKCKVPLPYPARRIGVWRLRCALCGIIVGVTTAGRADDPRSVTIACKANGNTQGRA